jgi:polar amino acid transport system substrate-binding protein
MNTNKRGIAWRLLSVFAVLAMVVAACGTEDGEGGGDGDDTTTTGDATTTTGDATTTTGDGTDTTAPADGDGDLTGMFPDGVVRIGIANEVPYGFEGDDGEPTGEAPEVAKAILGELGIETLEATVVDFGALIPGLQAGQYDMVAAGMFITPDRAEDTAFSNPDYCGTIAFAVEEGNPNGLTDFASVTETDAVLGVLGGAVEEGYAVDSGIPDDQISRFGDVPSLFDALTAGRVDAVPLTEVTVLAQVENLEGFEATEGFVPVIDGEEQLGCGAFAFSDTEFCTIFNDMLVQFQEEGRILPLVEEFGFSEASVERAKEVTVEQLGDEPACTQ